jgi:hypothetical protein
MQQQHPKDTPANAPLAPQSQDFGDFSKIELDPACAARADLSGITMQEVGARTFSLLNLNSLIIRCSSQLSS